MSSRADLVTAAALLAFGAAVVYESIRMPRFEHLNVNPYTVPGLVPGLLGAIIAVLALVMAVRSWRPALSGAAASGEPPLTARASRRIGLTLLITVVYGLVLVNWLPFWLATFVFVAVFIIVFEFIDAAAGANAVRLVSLALVQAAIVSAAVTLLFERIFLVTLP